MTKEATKEEVQKSKILLKFDLDFASLAEDFKYGTVGKNGRLHKSAGTAYTDITNLLYALGFDKVAHNTYISNYECQLADASRILTTFSCLNPTFGEYVKKATISHALEHHDCTDVVKGKESCVEITSERKCNKQVNFSFDSKNENGVVDRNLYRRFEYAMENGIIVQQHGKGKTIQFTHQQGGSYLSTEPLTNAQINTVLRCLSYLPEVRERAKSVTVTDVGVPHDIMPYIKHAVQTRNEQEQAKSVHTKKMCARLMCYANALLQEMQELQEMQRAVSQDEVDLLDGTTQELIKGISEETKDTLNKSISTALNNDEFVNAIKSHRLYRGEAR